MKMQYITLGIITLLIACGGGPDHPNSNNSKSVKSASVEVSKSVINSDTSSDRSSSLKVADSNSQDPTMTKEQLDKAKSIVAGVTEKDMENLKAGKLFKMHCALCHGFKGNMKINGAKDLTKSVLPLHEAVAQVYFGKGLMNPYKGVLDDAEIVAVCQYIEENLRK